MPFPSEGVIDVVVVPEGYLLPTADGQIECWQRKTTRRKTEANHSRRPPLELEAEDGDSIEIQGSLEVFALKNAGEAV